MRSRISVSVIAGFVLALSLAVTTAQSRASADEIVIGGTFDKSGPTVASQAPMLHGLEAYIRMVNDAGGINGRKIAFVQKDDGYNPATYLGAVKSLIADDNVSMIVGMGTSSGLSSVLPVINAAKVPGLMSQATLKESTYPFQPYLFTANCNLSDQMDVGLGYQLLRLKRKDLKGLTVGIAGIQAASGLEWLSLGTERVQRLGGTAVTTTLPASIVSADVQATDFASKKVDLALVHHAIPGGVAFLRSLDKFDVRVPVMGSYGVTGEPTFVSAPYEASKNFLGLNCITPPYLAKSPQAKKAVETGKKYGYPDSETSQLNWSLGWVNGMIVEAALKNANGDYSPAGVRKGLEKIRNLDTGLSPKITFDAKCHMAMRSVRPYTYSYKTKSLQPVGTYEQWQRYITKAYAAPGTCGVKAGKR